MLKVFSLVVIRSPRASSSIVKLRLPVLKQDFFRSVHAGVQIAKPGSGAYWVFAHRWRFKPARQQRSLEQGVLYPCALVEAPYLRHMELVITLLAVGFLLLLAETVLPGIIAGIIGLCCVIAGVVQGYFQFGVRTGNLILMGVLLALIVGFCLWLKYFPDSRMAKLFVSRRVVGEIGTEKPELLHQIGVAFTQLRPAGTALIKDRRVDVVTEGQLIERGTPIQVVALEGMRVVVRAL
jgi:hypothetical protein